MKTATLTVLAVLLWQAPAEAQIINGQGLMCYPTDVAVRVLKEKYSESKVFSGKPIGGGAADVVLYFNEIGRSWTMTASGNGLTCIVLVGKEGKMETGRRAGLLLQIPN